MQAEIFAEVVAIFVLILINGLLAMSEMAIVSARKLKLQQLASEGNSGAKAALQLGTDPSSFLAAIQIGITLIGILAGAFGGATIAEQISSQIVTIHQLEPYADALGLGSVVVVVTLLSLIFGELVPKRIALNNAETMAMLVAKPVRILSMVAHPAVRILSFITESVLRVFGIRKQNETPITEEEVKIIIEQGQEAGVFQEQEGTMIRRVMNFADRKVSEVMTQRIRLVMLDINAPFSVSYDRVNANPHSIFPAFDGNEDNIIGMVSSKRLLQELKGKVSSDFDLRKCLMDTIYVAETMPVLSVLEKFKQTGKHQALVIDEYGAIAGIVTLTDLLEAIVGDIPSENEREATSSVRREDGSLLVEGMLPIFELPELIGKRELELDENPNYKTLGGFVMHKLGHIPREGESFLWGGFKFEIIDMDKHRVDKVLITSHPG